MTFPAHSLPWPSLAAIPSRQAWTPRAAGHWRTISTQPRLLASCNPRTGISSSCRNKARSLPWRACVPARCTRPRVHWYKRSGRLAPANLLSDLGAPRWLAGKQSASLRKYAVTDEPGLYGHRKRINRAGRPGRLRMVNCLAANPEVNLWQADNSHPTEQGTYLAACVFYAVIFRQSPENLSYRGNLPSATAGYLQSLAANTVLHNPTQWIYRDQRVRSSIASTFLPDAPLQPAIPGQEYCNKPDHVQPHPVECSGCVEFPHGLPRCARWHARSVRSAHPP